jgi:hypothetical protein
MPNVKPYVLIKQTSGRRATKEDADETRTYLALLRFYGLEDFWMSPPSETWHNHLLDCLSFSKPDGTQEGMALITTDSQVFVSRAPLQAAWSILTRCHDVLGVSLMVSSNSLVTARGGVERWGPLGQYHLWEPSLDSFPGDGLGFGIIHRSADLLSLVSESPYNSPEALGSGLSHRTHLANKNKMACLYDPCLSIPTGE